MFKMSEQTESFEVPGASAESGTIETNVPANNSCIRQRNPESSEAITINLSLWTKTLTFTALLGSGAFGVVVKAKNIYDKSSAVKIIFPVSPMEGEKERILREYKNIVGKIHNNIVRPDGCAEVSLSRKEFDIKFRGIELNTKELVDRYTRDQQLDTIWIKMELCGYNLRHWLEQNSGKEPDRTIGKKQLGIIKGLVDGLGFLHHRNIMHRDFKPENIYFSQGDELPIKIGDFGMSRDLSDNSSNLTIVGTEIYRAPEVETSKYSYQADLYSLGLVMWETMQLISKTVTRGLFDRLVIDKEESLVHEHPLISSYRQIIINLTKRNVIERTQNIDIVASQVAKVDRKVSNSKELRRRVKYAKHGDIIELLEGEYDGSFDIKPDRITLQGTGRKDKTIIRYLRTSSASVRQFALRLQGNDCSVTNITFLSGIHNTGIIVAGLHNTISQVDINEGLIAVDVLGGEITFSNLRISNADLGIVLRKGGNKLHDITAKDMTIGIQIDGNGKNDLDKVKCYDVKRGVEVNGNENELRDIECKNHKLINDSYGLVICGGSGNSVNNLKSSGFCFGLYFYKDATKAMITESVITDGVMVRGSDHELVWVDGGREICISGRRHKIDNCKASKFRNGGSNIKLIGKSKEMTKFYWSKGCITY